MRSLVTAAFAMAMALTAHAGAQEIPDPAQAQGRPAESASACEITVFEDSFLFGRHQHMFNSEPNLNRLEGVQGGPQVSQLFNDRISSFVIHSGCWIFFGAAFFQEQLNPVPLLPGIYNDVRVPLGPQTNDIISSLRCDCSLPEDEQQ
jgi:hypothetical protein